MAGPYDTTGLDRSQKRNLASVRDSLYLLVAMNQYSIDPEALRANRNEAVPQDAGCYSSKPTEGLLRVALFSKDLRLLKRQRVTDELEHMQPVAAEPVTPVEGLAKELQALDQNAVEIRLEPPDELNAMRQKLAQQLRETRRKGVVPVFVSTLWFLFALAISIQSSFGIADRNPVSADDIRKKLNRLVDHVRKSLMDDQVRNMFINSIHAAGERADMRRRIEEVSIHCKAIDSVPFFAKFSGQGRVRWHYGAAHPILCDVEDAYVAQEGRHWLEDEARARTFLVLGKRTGGLDWLDYRELWQVAAAVICVCGTTYGAWVLSVGL
ncbi:hypothetical protein LTR36_005443 [Oleoguttula mirabilis]|uniref:Transmembrane protein n=1 Tax=Oleoguttula mirabilis TaxID=1507867 RepID=A0AAV9JEV4_9PEZI|nr:hypothetical protein LTR36_005443 [Oleoguttula mirabilis]